MLLACAFRQVGAAGRLRLERPAVRRQRRGLSGCQTVAQFGEHPCVDAVGLTDDAHRLGEVACLSRVDATEADLRGFERIAQLVIVAAAGLEYDPHTSLAQRTAKVRAAAGELLIRVAPWLAW